MWQHLGGLLLISAIIVCKHKGGVMGTVTVKFVRSEYWLPDLIGVAFDEEGRQIASHISSTVDWVKHDMGITSTHKHGTYQARYPDGFTVEWGGEMVGSDNR
jgi:hypothetical protein